MFDKEEAGPIAFVAQQSGAFAAIAVREARGELRKRGMKRCAITLSPERIGAGDRMIVHAAERFARNAATLSRWSCAGPADEVARAESQRFIDATEGRMSNAEAARLFHAGIRHMIDFFGLLRIKRLMRYIHFDVDTGHVDAARREANGPPR